MRFLFGNRDEIEIKKEELENIQNFQVSPPEPEKSITEKHRAVLQRARDEIADKIIRTNSEINDLTNAYKRRLVRLESDHREYHLSLRALEASIQVYEDQAQEDLKKKKLRVVEEDIDALKEAIIQEHTNVA